MLEDRTAVEHVHARRIPAFLRLRRSCAEHPDDPDERKKRRAEARRHKPSQDGPGAQNAI
jgi:hypothetical protein